MPISVKLPILSLNLREQRYSCHGCGNCCRDFTVQLREDDLAKLREQNWKEKLGEPVTIDFRGVTYLRQRENGACMFLMDDGKCRIHAEFGFEAKPIACQLFPFHLTPSSKGVSMGINFACQSVLENKGTDLKSHNEELQRMAGSLPEVSAPTAPPLLNDHLRPEPREVDALINHLDQWLKRTELRLRLRLDGLAWVTDQLSRAKLEAVRGKRLEDLLDLLFNALPDELRHHPIDPPTARQKKMLRQAVFARIEDPKLNTIRGQGRIRTILSQLSRSRRFRVGRGVVPGIGVGWIGAEVRFEAIEKVAQSSRLFDDESPTRSATGKQPATRTGGTPLPPFIDDAARIDDLMTRWLRATILGGRAWGAGYYGWPVIPGLQALLLNAACVGWLSRLHATGHHRQALDIIDVRAALGRIDRSAGRAPWLGGTIERMRLRYLQLDDGLRRVVEAFTVA